MKSLKEFITEMRLFRYRRPSLARMLGLTHLKKELRQASGLNTIARYTPKRIKQRLKQHVGIYGNNPLQTIRQLSKGHIKSPFKFIPKISTDYEED